MHRLSVGTLARAMALTMRASAEPRPAMPPAAPRLLCISVAMRKPEGLAPGWDPDRYEIVSPARSRWRRLWPDAWRWPRWARRSRPPRPVPATLFLAATPFGVRVTLDGLLADTSIINGR